MFNFEIGQIVHHKSYGYRGVIFGRDQFCKADESWYLNNKTQPDRGQPWYHVLVHGSDHTTYVAQSNLEQDENGTQVSHPMLDQFFNMYLKGRYFRRNLN